MILLQVSNAVVSVAYHFSPGNDISLSPQNLPFSFPLSSVVYRFNFHQSVDDMEF